MKWIFGLVAGNPLAAVVALAVAVGAVGAGYGYYRYQINKAYVNGFQAAEAQCEADNLRAELAETKRQLRAAESVRQQDQIQLSALEAEIDRREERAREHERQIAEAEAAREEAEMAAEEALAADPGVRVVYRNRCSGVGPAERQRLHDRWGAPRSGR